MTLLVMVILTALGLAAVVAYLIWARRFEHKNSDGVLEAERRRQAEFAKSGHKIDDSTREEHDGVRRAFDAKREAKDRTREMNSALARGKNRWDRK